MLVKDEHKNEHPYAKMSHAELLDIAIYNNLMLKKERKQSTWLDKLADHERDHADSSSEDERYLESKADVDEAYNEYKECSNKVQEKLN